MAMSPQLLLSVPFSVHLLSCSHEPEDRYALQARLLWHLLGVSVMLFLLCLAEPMSPA